MAADFRTNFRKKYPKSGFSSEFKKTGQAKLGSKNPVFWNSPNTNPVLYLFTGFSLLGGGGGG
jgi:hypothetical protein